MKFEKGKRTYVAVECDRCGRKEACKTLPRAVLLSQIQIQLQIHTHTYIQTMSLMTKIVQKELKRLVRNCHVPCCSHKYKYKYKYTHRHIR